MVDFEEAISNPENWFRQAWEMFHAAKALYEIFEKGGSVRTEEDNYRRVGSLKGAVLLLGFSVENALKGAHVYRFKPDLSRGRLNSKNFHEHGHDLADIADKLGLQLSEEQSDLLGRLTKYIQWSSRYQAPLKKADYEDSQAKIKIKHPTDFQLAQSLLLELKIHAGFDKKSGWPGA